MFDMGGACHKGWVRREGRAHPSACSRWRRCCSRLAMPGSSASGRSAIARSTTWHAPTETVCMSAKMASLQPDLPVRQVGS
jgi:hypothetical protein